MKYIVRILIFCIFSIAQSYAITSNLALRCDSLRLTDGRTVAVNILRQTDDRIFFTLCEEEAKKEGIILKRFVEAIIVNGIVVQEPAAYLKSKKRVIENNREAAKNGALLAGSGLVVIVLYKKRYQIAEALWIGLLKLLLD